MGNILVTGAGGLIGYAFARKLVDQGKYVIGYDLVDVGLDNQFYKAIKGDLLDVHRIYSLFKQYEIDAVVHCGAISGPMLALDNPFKICQINIMGTANVLEAARICGVERFVYCSSASAYGETHMEVINEETPLYPTDVYGATKASGEHLVQSFSEQHGLDGVSLRICWVYGPRRQTDCVIRNMIVDAIEDKPTILDWGQNSHRQFIYIDDVVSALVAAVENRKSSKTVYNVAGKNSYVSIEEVAQAVRFVYPKAHIEIGPGPDTNDSPRGPFDISAAEHDLGYSPQFDLLEGIKQYSKWLEHQKEIIKKREIIN